MQAVDYLAMPTIQSAVNASLEKIGFGSMFRLTTLYGVASGTALYHETRRVGEVVTRIEREPTAADRIRAVEVAARLAGDFDRARAEGNALSARFRELAKRFAPEPTVGATARARSRVVVDVDYTLPDAAETQEQGVESMDEQYTCLAMPCYYSNDVAV